MWFAKLAKYNYFLFEIFIVFRLLALMLPTIAKSLLIQDKICLFGYNQTAQFCRNIHLEMNSTADETAKDSILAEAARFGSYSSIIESIAMIVWSFFVGSFLDTFAQGTFVIMSLNLFGDLILSAVYLLLIYFYNSSVFYILFSSTSIWFSGGIMSFNATAYRYISINTEEKHRTIKFVILEIIFVIDVSFATFLSGRLVTIQSEQTSMLRTYHWNFFITIAIVLLSYVLLFLLFHVSQKQTKRTQRSDKASNQIAVIEVNNNSACEQEKSANESKQNLLKVLFNLDNVKQTLTCFFKSRHNNMRFQIFLLCSILFNQVLVTNGLSTVLLQFSEKVYQWTGAQYATFSAVQQISQMLLLGFLLQPLISVLKLENGTLILLSQVSILLTDLVRGLFLSPTAFFVSLPIGSLTGIGAISVKSKLAAIIPSGEIGKIFSVSSTIEAMVPFAASLIYSTIFSLSIGTFPGVVYLFSCAVMIVSIGINLVERFCCPVKSIAEKKSRNIFLN